MYQNVYCEPDVRLVINHLYQREIPRDFTTRWVDLIRNECDERNLVILGGMSLLLSLYFVCSFT